jgi:hypothetical protein
MYEVMSDGVKYEGEYVVQTPLAKPEFIKYLPTSRAFVVAFDRNFLLFRDGEPIKVSTSGEREAHIEEIRRAMFPRSRPLNVEDSKISNEALLGIGDLDENRIVLLMKSLIGGVYIYNLTDNSMESITFRASASYVIGDGLVVFKSGPVLSLADLRENPARVQQLKPKKSIVMGFINTEYVIARHDKSTPLMIAKIVDDGTLETVAALEQGNISKFVTCGTRFAFVLSDGTGALKIMCYSYDGELLFKDDVNESLELIQFNGENLVLYIRDNNKLNMLEFTHDFMDGSGQELPENVYAIVQTNQILM